MIRIEIPCRGMIELQHAVFDINGTLAVDGMPIPEVVGRLKKLATQLSSCIDSRYARQYGRASTTVRSPSPYD